MPDITSQLKTFLVEGETVERCGLILKNQIIETENRHPEPDKGFAIPVGDMHKHIKRLVGTWHTHPNEDSFFSQQDYIGFAQWPGLIHYIVGTDGVRAYRADESGIIEEVLCN